MKFMPRSMDCKTISFARRHALAKIKGKAGGQKPSWTPGPSPASNVLPIFTCIMPIPEFIKKVLAEAALAIPRSRHGEQRGQL